MSSIVYRYSPLGDDNELTMEQLDRLGLRNAFGQILIVSTPDLSTSSLLAITELLSSQPALLFANPDVTRIGGGGCPVVVEVADNRLLSDRSFWTLVYGSVNDPFQIVERFVRAVIDCPESHPDMMPDRQSGLVAEDAVYAYFDTCLAVPKELDSRIDNDTLAAYAQLFYDYLLICDLEHEVRQDAYITQLLGMLRRHPDTSLFYQLAAYRIGHGQFFHDFRRNEVREWLSFRGLLRKMVDEDLAELSGDLETDTDAVGWGLASLISIAYGSAPEADAVYDYVLTAGGFDPRSHVVKGTFDKSIAWADFQGPAPRTDTGFHTTEFSPDDATWKWVSAES